jgi:hypothetical protein
VDSLNNPDNYDPKNSPLTHIKQERQFMYNVTLRRIRELLLPWKSNTDYLLVRVSVRACPACMPASGYPGSWACACAFVHVALLHQHATRMPHIVTSFVAPHSPPIFFFLHCVINGVIFGKLFLNIKCVF